MTTIRIDPEFKALIPPLTPDELRQLEENIRRDGCRDGVLKGPEPWFQTAPVIGVQLPLIATQEPTQ